MSNTTATTQVTVAESSTGLVHRAYVRKSGRYTTATARCATDHIVGARAVYLRGARTVERSALVGKLCKKCFPAA